MSYRLLELPGTIITNLSLQKDRCTVTFSDALIIKVMDAAQQRTRWKQSGCIVIKGGFEDLLNNLKIKFPIEIERGEFQDNVFVYYDTIRLPCHAYGDVGISLIFQKYTAPLRISGKEIEVILEGDPQYIAHIN